MVLDASALLLVEVINKQFFGKIVGPGTTITPVITRPKPTNCLSLASGLIFL